MLNKYQQNILTNATVPINNLEDLKAELLAELSSSLNVQLTSDPYSNIGLLNNTISNKIITANLTFLEIIENITAYFDVNRFDGIASGSYAGLRNALLDLNCFTDVKIVDTTTNATIKIIVLPKNDSDGKPLDIRPLKQDIANTIHANRSVGILTASGAGASTVNVPASTGEQKSYSYFVGTSKTFDIEVSYWLDFEEPINNYDFDTQIKRQITQIYTTNYGYLGKNIKVQDFYSMVKVINGIGKVSITFTNHDTPSEVYTDSDIALDITNIFILGNVTTKQGN